MKQFLPVYFTGRLLEIINLIKDLYINASSTFQTDKGVTTKLKGFKQGHPLSLILFNLTLKSSIRTVLAKAKKKLQEGINEIPAAIYGIPFSILVYANDLVLVSRSTKSLQQLLDKAGLAATMLCLNFKPSKCATLTFNCRGGTKVSNNEYNL